MKVGYAVLYTDGTLVISKNSTLSNKNITKDYGEFEDINVPWKDESLKIKKIQILDPVKSNCMKVWFENCIYLTTLINFKDLDTSNCIYFSKMFSYCVSLQNINGLENWNVENGMDFSFMFAHCKSLQDISVLQNWNVSKDEYFKSMFYNCKSLQDISVSNTLTILTKKMFYNCNPNLKIHWKKHTYTYADLLEYEEIC